MNQRSNTIRPEYLTVVPDLAEACPSWCVSTHVGEEPTDLVHLSAVETAGPVELYDQHFDGTATTIVQIQGYASESLDADELDKLITALIRHRETITGGAR